jgi:hypothetical protein
MNKYCLNRHYDCPVAINHGTVLHHDKGPWVRQMPPVQSYLLGTVPDNEMVYFREVDYILGRNDPRTALDQKRRAPDWSLNYCFSSRANGKYSDSKASTARFAIEHTHNGSCDCAVRNPSGQCYLKEFPGQ